MNTDFNPKEFRNALGAFMTGVTVVTTTDTQSGVPVGFTANSFTSLSLDPPLVLVCLGCKANLYEVFENAEGFAVNILGAHQREISNCFASPVEDRFADIHWSQSAQNNPIIADTAAWFDCVFERRFVAGDHMVMIGEVKGFDSQNRPSLGYTRGSYFNENIEKQALKAVSHDKPVRAGAVVDYQGKVMLVNNLSALPTSKTQTSAAGAMNELREYLDRLGVVGELGWLYAVQQEAENAFNSMYFHVNATYVPDELIDGAQMVPMQNVELQQVSGFASGVLERYIREHARGRFGIYFGSEGDGDVAMR